MQHLPATTTWLETFPLFYNQSRSLPFPHTHTEGWQLWQGVWNLKNEVVLEFLCVYKHSNSFICHILWKVMEGVWVGRGGENKGQGLAWLTAIARCCCSCCCCHIPFMVFIVCGNSCCLNYAKFTPQPNIESRQQPSPSTLPIHPTIIIIIIMTISSVSILVVIIVVVTAALPAILVIFK